MKTINYDEYKEKVEENSYFKNRWEYFSVVIEEANRMTPKSVLEVGAAGFPIFPDCITLDVEKKYNPTICQNAEIIPWPFLDKQFDLFISLQTWEHLGKRQVEAFTEVRRVAKSAILSFPYKWTGVEVDDIHYNLSEKDFSVWTHGLPHREILVGNRMIYIFDTL